MVMNSRQYLLFLLACAIPGLLFPAAASETQIPVKTDRWSRQPFELVWKTTMDQLAEEGWKVVREEPAKGIILTDFLDFDREKFGPSVAIKPPRLSWDYAIYHRVILDVGRCRLKLSVRASGQGTRVSVAAVVEEHTFHRDLMKWFWASRESNGAIEIHVLDALEEALLEPVPTEPDMPPETDTDAR